MNRRNIAMISIYLAGWFLTSRKKKVTKEATPKALDIPNQS